jgi:hypothetical protein
MDDIEDRVEKLKRDAAALSGGKMVTGTALNCPPEIQEQFWKNVLAFENAPEVQPFDELLRAGLTLPPAEELDDVALTEALWAMVRGLEDLGVYLEFTNHLSDRELYVRLWSKVLREPMALTPDDLQAAWHIDMSGAGSDDDGTEAYLMYYADEETRRWWAEEYPDCPVPERKELPFDRDRRLPSVWASGESG